MIADDAQAVCRAGAVCMRQANDSSATPAAPAGEPPRPGDGGVIRDQHFGEGRYQQVGTSRT